MESILTTKYHNLQAPLNTHLLGSIKGRHLEGVTTLLVLASVFLNSSTPQSWIGQKVELKTLNANIFMQNANSSR